MDGVDLTGRAAIVTGAASGIGVETARALAKTGAAVTLAVRDVSAGRRVADDIRTTIGSSAVQVAELDLADIASVDAFSSAWQGPLHVLVNNAGVMLPPEAYTAPGWELQFATNHMGHFPWLSACTTHWLLTGTRESCRSAPAGMATHRWCSMTCSSTFDPTIPARPRPVQDRERAVRG